MCWVAYDIVVTRFPFSLSLFMLFPVGSRFLFVLVFQFIGSCVGVCYLSVADVDFFRSFAKHLVGCRMNGNPACENGTGKREKER